MGENYEHSVMYRDFEQVAREEGFTQIADAFKHVGEVEAEHEARYLALMANIQEGRVFQRPQTVAWQCRNCGYIYMGTEAPKAAQPAPIRKASSSSKCKTTDACSFLFRCAQHKTAL